MKTLICYNYSKHSLVYFSLKQLPSNMSYPQVDLVLDGRSEITIILNYGNENAESSYVNLKQQFSSDFVWVIDRF